MRKYVILQDALYTDDGSIAILRFYGFEKGIPVYESYRTGLSDFDKAAEAIYRLEVKTP